MRARGTEEKGREGKGREGKKGRSTSGKLFQVLRRMNSISGNGKQVRDVLHSKDAVNLYYMIYENVDKINGQVFNIGGGIKNSLSLLELFSFLENELGIKMDYTNIDWRESDQKVFVADIDGIKKKLNWDVQISSNDGIKNILGDFDN